MKKIILLGIFFISINFSLLATYCVSKGTGNWENAATWSCGHVPVCGDSIKILSTHTITITAQENYGSPCIKKMYINIYGILTFKNGSKIFLPVGSAMIIQSGGQLKPGTGGGSSNLVNIGSVTVWNSTSGTDFGYAVLGLVSIPLPIELIKFEVQANDNSVAINWATASETNNDFFTIENSRDAITFRKVSSIKGAGNSTNFLNYNLIDNKPLPGDSYYRLSQTDFDGTTSYFNLAKATFNESINLSFNIYPNPNNGVCINLQINTNKGAKTSVVLTDINGKLVYSNEILIFPDNSEAYTFCAKEKLNPGIYIVKIISLDKEYCQKIVIE